MEVGNDTPIPGRSGLRENNRTAVGRPRRTSFAARSGPPPSWDAAFSSGHTAFHESPQLLDGDQNLPPHPTHADIPPRNQLVERTARDAQRLGSAWNANQSWCSLLLTVHLSEIARER